MGSVADGFGRRKRSIVQDRRLDTLQRKFVGFESRVRLWSILSSLLELGSPEEALILPSVTHMDHLWEDQAAMLRSGRGGEIGFWIVP